MPLSAAALGVSVISRTTAPRPKLSDSITLANKPFFGDGTITAQVESMSNMAASGQAGVMLRESIAVDAGLLMIGISPSGEILQSVRTATGEAVTVTSVATVVSLPTFFRITREGNSYMASYSIDELAWTDLPAVNLSFGLNSIGGMASASGDNGTRARVTFREWENRDVATYPSALRSDGLPEYLAFAFGIDAGANGPCSLPQISLSQDGGALYPELTFDRRIGLNSSDFVIRYMGEDLSLWEDHGAFWNLFSTSDNGDGLTENIVMRRNLAVGAEQAAFFSVEVQP